MSAAKEDYEQEYLTYTQEKYYQLLYEGAGWMLDSPGYGEPEEFLWTYDPAFPLQQILIHKGDTEKWKQWWDTELALAKDINYDDYYQELAVWWLASPWEEPVVIAEGTDGTWYLWDGYHRTAISVVHSQRTIPAFVGKRLL